MTAEQKAKNIFITLVALVLLVSLLYFGRRPSPAQIVASALENRELTGEEEWKASWEHYWELMRLRRVDFLALVEAEIQKGEEIYANSATRVLGHHAQLWAAKTLGQGGTFTGIDMRRWYRENPCVPYPITKDATYARMKLLFEKLLRASAEKIPITRLGSSLDVFYDPAMKELYREKIEFDDDQLYRMEKPAEYYLCDESAEEGV